MTFKEYIGQSNPEKQSVGSVILESNDYKILYTIVDFIYVYIPFLNILYVKKSDSDVLWTQDEHGNPKNRSVFQIV